MKLSHYLKTTPFLLTIIILNLFSAPSILLEDKNLNQGNYTAVRIWHSKKLPQGSRVGHAALQIFENYSPVFNASLFPDASAGPLDLIQREAKASWHSAEQDVEHGGTERIHLSLFS